MATKLRSGRKGQSGIEYILLLIAIIAGIWTMRTFARYIFQGKAKDSVVSVLGKVQYDPAWDASLGVITTNTEIY